jgi:hypothetical protein
VPLTSPGEIRIPAIRDLLHRFGAYDRSRLQLDRPLPRGYDPEGTYRILQASNRGHSLRVKTGASRRP